VLRAGFSADDLDIPGFLVTHFEAVTVLRRALTWVDDPRPGLELGLRSNLANLRVPALRMLASSAPGDAFHRLLTTAHQHALTAMTLLGDDLAPFLVDALFTGLAHRGRQGAGVGYVRLTVELMREPPARAALYGACFGCPVHFACGRNRLVSDTRWMGWPAGCPAPMPWRCATQTRRGVARRASRQERQRRLR
jgi:hypothetical protein